MKFNFDEEQYNLRITVDSPDTGVYISKTFLNHEQTWAEIMMGFVHVLNGCGYIIDPALFEKFINEFEEANRKTLY